MAGASFPVWHSIRVGYTETFRNLGKILRLAWLPFLWAFLARFLIDLAGVISPTNALSQFPITGPLLMPIMYTRMFVVDGGLAVFALAMFRYRLLGWSEATDHVRLELGKREFVFLSAALLFNAIHLGLWSYFIAAGQLVAGEMFFGGLDLSIRALQLVTLLVFARICFALAQFAAGSAISLRLSFGDWVSLVVILVMTAGPFEFLRSVPTYLSYLSITTLDIVFYPTLNLFGIEVALLLSSFVDHVVFLALAFLGIAVAVTAVSAAYQSWTVVWPSA